MKSKLLIIALVLTLVSANENGCDAGKLVKDPVTGKITREAPKEESCEAAKEVLPEPTPDPFSVLLEEEDDDVS